MNVGVVGVVVSSEIVHVDIICGIKPFVFEVLASSAVSLSIESVSVV